MKDRIGVDDRVIDTRVSGTDRRGGIVTQATEGDITVRWDDGEEEVMGRDAGAAQLVDDGADD